MGGGSSKPSGPGARRFSRRLASVFCESTGEGETFAESAVSHHTSATAPPSTNNRTVSRVERGAGLNGYTPLRRRAWYDELMVRRLCTTPHEQPRAS